MIGAPALHERFAPYKSGVHVLRRPTQVQLTRGEFLKTAPYWAGVVSVRLGAIAEKKVSQHSCVWGSVWVSQPVHYLFHTAVRAYINNFLHVLLDRVE